MTSPAIAMLEQIVAELKHARLSLAVARTSAEAPRFLSVPRYAALTGYSERKVRRLVKLGLPMTRAPGEKHHKVIVAEANAWIARGGAEAAVVASAQSASRQMVSGSS